MCLTDSHGSVVHSSWLAWGQIHEPRCSIPRGHPLSKQKQDSFTGLKERKEKTIEYPTYHKHGVHNHGWCLSLKTLSLVPWYKPETYK